MANTSDLPESFYYTQPINFTKVIDTNTLKDKSVIVTGGASGIGEGCVKAFAEAGCAQSVLKTTGLPPNTPHSAYVTILDINEANGTALTKSLTEKGHQ